ncbi:D-alanyl-D-alanine carboxypeptidase family protein [Streptomyces sp. NPDC101132]|uniref:D-alanyl-D-alanine carboxypeptidase family protein n=1 Tax=Streptomyces sp. NPDC101132 TaxID=3366110 RepID=UPI0037F6016D
MAIGLWYTVRARGGMALSLSCAVLLCAAPSAPAAPDPAVRTAAGVPAPPRVSAAAWMVTDAESGAVLAAREAHRPLPPASTLKTLFAVTVLPRLRGDLAHTVSSGDLAGVAPGSSLVGVKEGHTYTVADLWRGVFLSSGNDAVRTLAGLNGGWRHTIREMQTTAERLGARETVVRSPDGYDAPGQTSSAYDLTLFARAGLRNADFRTYAATTAARFPAAGGPRSFGIRNTNRLLVGSHGVAPYPGLIGVKNGYTSRAGNTLVSAARRGGRTVLVTLLRPRSNRSNAVYEESRALLDWGFAAAPRARGAVERLPDPADAPGDTGAAGPPAASGTPGDEESGGLAWPATAGGAALLLGAFFHRRRTVARRMAARRATHEP